jgi:hypothetical protein
MMLVMMMMMIMMMMSREENIDIVDHARANKQISQ